MILNLEFQELQTILQIKQKIISILSFNSSYGKGQNKADTLPKTGKKQQLVEQLVINCLFLVFTTSNSITQLKIKTKTIISSSRNFHNY